MEHPSRRSFIGQSAITVAGLLVSGCRQNETSTSGTKSSTELVGGSTREIAITIKEAEVEYAPGKRMKTFTIGGTVPGQLIEARRGERLRITVNNQLPEPSSLHWHGIPLPNPMDGVPGVTQDPIPAGGKFVYDYVAEPSGTFMYHSHSGLQLDRGVYAPLIIHDAKESTPYDREYTLMFDDWLTESSDDVMKKLKSGEGMAQGGQESSGTQGMANLDGAQQTQPGMPGMDRMGPGGPAMAGRHGMGSMGRGGPAMAGMQGMGRMEGAVPKGTQGASGSGAAMEDNGVDVIYAAFLVNGKNSEIAEPLRVRKGDRVRLRLINPSGATNYRIALDGHRLTVTHADGNPVQPIEVDTLEIGMGERYDVYFTANNPGVWALMAASPEDPRGRVRTLVRYEGATGTPPPIDFMPAVLKSGRILRYTDLIAAEPGEVISVKPDRTHELVLNGTMMPYRWTINDQTFPEANYLEIGKGERVRLRLVNKSMMRHPMHLHGHFYRLLGTAGGTRQAPAKDTVILNAMQTMEVEFLADNPGKWAFHCHHAYHQDAGMMRVFAYRS